MRSTNVNIHFIRTRFHHQSFLTSKCNIIFNIFLLYILKWLRFHTIQHLYWFYYSIKQPRSHFVISNYYIYSVVRILYKRPYALFTRWGEKLSRTLTRCELRGTWRFFFLQHFADLVFYIIFSSRQLEVTGK